MLIAIYEQATAGNSMHYIYSDYLGSVRCITNSSATVESRLSFDAWGNRRNYLTGDKLTTVPTGLITARGFTGHEHIDDFVLINMNGRIYDPALGMFLSPDNNIQAPDFTQNFNRYAYCLNNPLVYSDPSGDFIFSLFLPVIGPLLDAACWGAVIGGAGYTASVAFSDGGFNNWNGGDFWKSVGFGAASGFLTAGVGQIFGPIGSAGFSSEIGRAFTHGVSQAWLSGITGYGDPMTAFTSAGLGSLAGSAFMMYGGKFSTSTLGSYAFSGLAGGLGAELTGGNFLQGAGTGLMIAGLNHLQQGISYSIRSGNRELNPDNIVLKNSKLRNNVKQLYEGLVDDMGTDSFQYQVTGGDRYVGPDGKVYSSTNNDPISGSGRAHIANLAVDLRIKYNNGSYIPLDIVKPVVSNSTQLIFDPNAMPWHYDDWHYHLQLPRIP
jgi:RHS repeat-associated protein